LFPSHDQAELIESNKSELLQELEARHEAMEFPFGYHQEAHKYGMNHEVKFTWHYRGMLNKLSLRKMLKAHPDFNDYYITLNELDVVLKKLSTKWENGEWTRQINLDNGKRIRVYCTHPLEFNGRYITEMTEGELGKLYENEDPNINLDKMPF
jgi:hypothetical protein